MPPGGKTMIKISHTVSSEGWCECDIHIDDHSVHISGTYKNKRCKDLWDATEFLLNGGICSQCALSNPNGDFLIMLKRDGYWLHLKVIALNEPFSNNSQIQGQTLFSEKTPLSQFANCINPVMH